jgi:hypothetical protein
MVTSRVPPITVVTYGMITMAGTRKAALKGNEDRYVDAPAGDGILLRLARDPAGNLNSVSYQPNVNYRSLSRVTECHALTLRPHSHHWPQSPRVIYAYLPQMPHIPINGEI